MEHKKLLENVMIELLKDPACPINQFQDWQFISICQQLQLQNFSNMKDYDFQKKFAQFFINYLETENEIQNILEQSSIKRGDSNKIHEDRSHQNNQCSQMSNKQKNDYSDTIRNKIKVKLKNQMPSNFLEIEENPSSPNSVNQQLVITQAPKISQQSIDPSISINNHQDKSLQKEKIEKVTSNEQKLKQSIIERQVKDFDFEPYQRKKNKTIKEFQNQVQSVQIFQVNDNFGSKQYFNINQKKQEGENYLNNIENKIIEQNIKKNQQIQIKKKSSRAIIDTSPEKEEIVIEISDSESDKQRNISNFGNKNRKYQMDDLIQVKSNKIYRKQNIQKQKLLVQQNKTKDLDFNLIKQANPPLNKVLLNQDNFQSIDRIEFEIQKQKQLLENQYNQIQSEPYQKKTDFYQKNLERNIQNSSSICILQQKNSLQDIQNIDSTPIYNSIFGNQKEPQNFIYQNQQINQNDYSGINIENNQQSLKNQNLYPSHFNQNKQLYHSRQQQIHVQNPYIQNKMFQQSDSNPQFQRNTRRILENDQNLEGYEKKPKLEIIDVSNDSIEQYTTLKKYLQINNNQNQCNYCKQIDGKIKLIEIEDEIKICQSCLFEKLNPFKKIIYNLGYLEYQYQSKQQSKIHIDFTIQQELFLCPGLQLEIRCVMMNKNGLTDFTFPNSCILQINGAIIQEFKPLIDKSCLKKRKDQCILINLDTIQKTYGIQKKYTLTCIEIIPDSKMRQEIPQQIYIFGLFLVQDLSLDQVIHSIVQKSILSQIKIDVYKNEIKVDKSKVSLICQYSFDLIKIPARGEFCQHQQCFSLNNYLDMMIHAEHMKWICPICKKNCISLIIDHYQWEILKKLQQLNIKLDYITVNQNGTLDTMDPFYPIFSDKKIKSYSDLISQGYNNFERSFLQFENENEIISQSKFQPQGENELNAILID
ncbi:unnamed protein product [Paramecium sonneborni]|uniref:SP-RING-type domain-containing protein n=1 Tax=Paramecium sonneborni TaxID=65129 RepID=A0A8S1KAQ8_9CILI|nr:unnamed protein product [Paramecium sonneborni]